MVGKLLNGESRGEAFRAALVSLRDNGVVDCRPARRRNSRGEIVPVWAKQDAEYPPVVGEDGQRSKAPTVVSEDTVDMGGGCVSKVPNRFSDTSSYSGDGYRVHQSHDEQDE